MPYLTIMVVLIEEQKEVLLRVFFVRPTIVCEKRSGQKNELKHKIVRKWSVFNRNISTAK